MNERKYLAPVSPGWRKRQMIAEAKQTNGQTREERQKIAEIRRRHRLWEEEQARKANAGELTESAPEPTEPEPVAQEPEPDVGDDAAAEDEPEAGEAPGPADMDRDALIAELQDAGQRVHPASKDATLRAKVEALRGD